MSLAGTVDGAGRRTQILGLAARRPQATQILGLAAKRTLVPVGTADPGEPAAAGQILAQPTWVTP